MPKKLQSTSEHEHEPLEQGVKDSLPAGSGGMALHGMSGNLSTAETRECVGCCGCGTTNETTVGGREGGGLMTQQLGAFKPIHIVCVFAFRPCLGCFPSHCEDDVERHHRQ